MVIAGHVTWLATHVYSNHYLRAAFKSDFSQFVLPPDNNDPDSVALSHTGTAIIHPLYYSDGRCFPNTYDTGVIVLDEEVYVDNYGELPEIGVLDTMATTRALQDRIFTTVGYSFQSVRPFLQIEVVRYKVTSMLVDLRSAFTDGYNLHTSNNPGKGQGTGGQCSGDSGGPIFFDDTRIIAAIVSFGLNNNCKGMDFGYNQTPPMYQVTIGVLVTSCFKKRG